MRLFNFVKLSIYIVMFMYYYCYVWLCLCVFCFIVLFSVLFACKCVLYYCHGVTTQMQLTNISYTEGCAVLFEVLLTIQVFRYKTMCWKSDCQRLERKYYFYRKDK
jgi:hypothetical protein